MSKKPSKAMVEVMKLLAAQYGLYEGGWGRGRGWYLTYLPERGRTRRVRDSTVEALMRRGFIERGRNYTVPGDLSFNWHRLSAAGRDALREGSR